MRTAFNRSAEYTILWKMSRNMSKIPVDLQQIILELYENISRQSTTQLYLSVMCRVSYMSLKTNTNHGKEVTHLQLDFAASPLSGIRAFDN